MSEISLTKIKIFPVESGDNLKVYALNGNQGQCLNGCCCNQDSHLIVQQGVIRLQSENESRWLQAREDHFFHAGESFTLTAMTDVRAQLVTPESASLNVSDQS